MNIGNTKIAVVGLGYVGAPLALALSGSFPVVGFDLNVDRVVELEVGEDRTGELDKHVLRQQVLQGALKLTTSEKEMADADVIIITVPTPVTDAHVPDLSCVIAASRAVGRVMKTGAIVVYESTVYPGATEEVCLPELIASSGKNYPEDFAIGYSPERINPGDEVHVLTNTVKIVSGDRPEVLNLLAQMYGSITQVHLAPTIKVAEGAKVLENVQRDVNIALMNEAYQIFSRIGVDTHDVLEAAGTKWNFLKFTPGLVGGHCISVDPYYLSHKAASEGFPAKLIMSSRETNDAMPAFLVDKLIKKMVSSVGLNRNTVVTILGATFKEDVPDVRNSKVADICKELAKYGVTVQVVDPVADASEVAHEVGVGLTAACDAVPADAVILAVPHQEFLEAGWGTVASYAKNEQALVMDFKARMCNVNVPEHIELIR